MGLTEILIDRHLQIIGDWIASMQNITGTETTQKLKQMFGLIWEMGTHCYVFLRQIKLLSRQIMWDIDL